MCFKQPIREVLAQLTGDVDAQLARGAISQENAGRLRQLLGVSGQALVELGPDLIDIFVSGVGLLVRAGTFAAEKAGWLGKLEQLVKRPRGEAIPGGTTVEQDRIFEAVHQRAARVGGAPAPGAGAGRPPVGGCGIHYAP